MNLHWHTDENPCLLCGVPVTPESWIGGVIESQHGEWVLKTRDGIDPDDGGYTDSEIATFTPIFPPAGWAGKSDAELWKAVFGADGKRDNRDLFYWLNRCDIGDGSINVSYDGRIWAFIQHYEDDAEITDVAAALILALQNAQVLAARLAVKP